MSLENKGGGVVLHKSSLAEDESSKWWQLFVGCPMRAAYCCQVRGNLLSSENFNVLGTLQEADGTAIRENTTVIKQRFIKGYILQRRKNK